jgi:hypothetical protein
VLAQPDPDLAERTIAALEDGTPLVTRKAVGEGQVVLVHVTANAEWSNLPLSGLFVQMLERLAVSARPRAGGGRSGGPDLGAARSCSTPGARARRGRPGGGRRARCWPARLPMAPAPPSRPAFTPGRTAGWR